MIRILERGARAIIAAAFAMMVLAAILQVVSRYVFNSPLGWTEELAKLLMVWWTFLAVGMLALQGRLLGIDALLMAMSAKAAHLTLATAQAISAIFIGWLTWLGVRLVDLAGTQITPALDIPYAWVYLSLPVGLAGATAGFLFRAGLHVSVALSPAPVHPIAALERTDA